MYLFINSLIHLFINLFILYMSII